jgi:hypothetical protein
MQYPFCEVSAKTGEGITELFAFVAESLSKTHPEEYTERRRDRSFAVPEY